MAAVDDYVIHIQGKGGHAAYPHGTRDPLIAAASIAQGLNAIVTRDLDPREDLIVAVTQIHGGSAHNIVPDTAMIAGTVRSFDPDVRDMAERRLREIVAGQAAAFGVSAEVEYERGDPPVVNHAREVALAAEVASEVVGETRVTTEYKREMGAEDFAHMLDARPGAYLFLGAGEGAGLHHPKYDFNDEISPIGASFFARLVETLQPV
jgi:amidohydrolase